MTKTELKPKDTTLGENPIELKSSGRKHWWSATRLSHVIKRREHWKLSYPGGSSEEVTLVLRAWVEVNQAGLGRIDRGEDYALKIWLSRASNRNRAQQMKNWREPGRQRTWMEDTCWGEGPRARWRGHSPTLSVSWGIGFWVSGFFIFNVRMQKSADLIVLLQDLIVIMQVTGLAENKTHCNGSAV